MIKLLVKLPIFKRFIPSVIKKLNIENYSYKSDGLKYELDLRYLVDRRFYLFGWDQDIIKYLNSFIKEKSCDYFLDIGSCWGVYSLQIAHKNSKIKVFAFDVFEKNIERLKKMAKINGIDNIKTFNNAIGAQKKLKLFQSMSNTLQTLAKILMVNIKLKFNKTLLIICLIFQKKI